MAHQRRPRSSQMTAKPNAKRLTTDEDALNEEIKKTVPLIDQVPLRRSQSFPNLSVDFADSWSFWLYYLCIIFLCWYSLVVFPFLQFWPALTIVNIIHALVMYIYTYIYICYLSYFLRFCDIKCVDVYM